MNQQKSTFRIGYLLSVVNIVYGVLYFGFAILVLAIPQASSIGWNAIHTVILLFTPWLVLDWVMIHYTVPKEKRFFTLGSLVFLAILAVLTSINRYNALTVVPHAAAVGRTDGLEWFQPYGSPSIMMSIEILGWGWFYGLACLCLAPVFAKDRRERAIFWTLILSAVFSLGSILGPLTHNMWLNFIGVPAWGPGLILLSALLARWFKRQEAV